jgi:hypothetical protein
MTVLGNAFEMVNGSFKARKRGFHADIIQWNKLFIYEPFVIGDSHSPRLVLVTLTIVFLQIHVRMHRSGG